jgi:hypothetical protein
MRKETLKCTYSSSFHLIVTTAECKMNIHLWRKMASRILSLPHSNFRTRVRSAAAHGIKGVAHNLSFPAFPSKEHGRSCRLLLLRRINIYRVIHFSLFFLSFCIIPFHSKVTW